MLNEEFKTKIAQLEAMQEELDKVIWPIFDRYISTKKINFNGAESWEIRGDDIYFSGTDGCYGCYDPMSLSIPFDFFYNTDEAFGKLNKELIDKKEKAQYDKTQSDLKLLSELKERYEGVLRDE